MTDWIWIPMNFQTQPIRLVHAFFEVELAPETEGLLVKGTTACGVQFAKGRATRNVLLRCSDDPSIAPLDACKKCWRALKGDK